MVLRRDALWGQWKLNCRRANFASRVVWKQRRCVSCWSVCSDDQGLPRPGQKTHLDRRGIHGPAAWFYGAEWHGANDTSGESVFWTCICVSWTAGRSRSRCCGGTATGCVFSRSGSSVERFIWPQATSGTVSLTRAQLSMLLEGIDWRRPVRTQTPQLAGVEQN